MTQKTHRRIYLTSTVLFTAFMLMNAGMYLFNTAFVSAAFLTIGYPTYLIYPMAAAKLLGLYPIWSNKYPRLKEWAYAGYTYIFILGALGHFMAGDGQFGGALVALAILLVSYKFSGQTGRASTPSQSQ